MLADAVLNDHVGEHKAKLEAQGWSVFRVAGAALAIVTFMGVIFGCISACCATEKCHFKCCAIIMISVSSVVFLALAIVMFVVGAAFLVPSQLGSKFIDENCEKASTGKFNEIQPAQAQEFFKMFNDLDDTYKTAVNGNMCNDVCICPGATGDAWYDEYKALDTTKLNSFGRTWDTVPADDLKSLYFVEGVDER